MKYMYSEPYQRNRLIFKNNILITLFLKQWGTFFLDCHFEEEDTTEGL